MEPPAPFQTAEERLTAEARTALQPATAATTDDGPQDEDTAQRAEPYHHAPAVHFDGGAVAEGELVAVLARYEEALDNVAAEASAASSSTTMVQAP
eukprot:8442700-Prorocentrum_lima.AAC.1